MKKKIYSLLLMLVCVFALSACGEEVKVQKDTSKMNFAPQMVIGKNIHLAIASDTGAICLSIKASTLALADTVLNNIVKNTNKNFLIKYSFRLRALK